MSEIDRFRAVRAHAARTYAGYAGQLADALEANPAGEPHALMTACSQAWNQLVHADWYVRAEILGGDPIDDFYKQPVEVNDV